MTRPTSAHLPADGARQAPLLEPGRLGRRLAVLCPACDHPLATFDDAAVLLPQPSAATVPAPPHPEPARP